MATEPTAARRCRPRSAPRPDGDLRPTDVVGAFFVCGIAFLAAAALAGIVEAVHPWPWGSWLALHLAFVGGVSPLVLGAAQFFVGAFLATDPPPRALVRAQLAAWNLGAIGLALAIPLGAGAAIWVAVALLLTALVLWAAAIATMWRRSLRRSPWAVAWYCAGALFLGLGVIAGSLLAHGVPWTHGDLLGAHMSLNLAGWFGGSIGGTLHTFFPSLTQTRLRRPRLQPLAFAAWTAGVAALAMLAVAALALAEEGGPGALHAPAKWLLLAVYAVLAARVAQLAARVLLRARPSL